MPTSELFFWINWNLSRIKKNKIADEIREKYETDKVAKISSSELNVLHEETLSIKILKLLKKTRSKNTNENNNKKNKFFLKKKVE